MRIAIATCSNLPDWEVDDAPLFAAFRAAGAEPIAAVWDDPSVGWEGFDACLIRTTWDYMEKRDAFVQWARRVARATRLFNSPEVVEWNTRKTYLRELAAKGVPIAPTLWLRRGSALDLAEVMRDQGWRAGFIKPVIGATARETMRFAADAQGIATAQAHLQRMLADEDMMLQPYLRRVETEGERSAIFIDGAFTHAVRKIPVAGDYRVQDDFGARDFPIELGGEELELARWIVSQVELPLLYARVDFLRGDAGELVVTELELVEPSLFFRHCSSAAERLAQAVLRSSRREGQSTDDADETGDHARIN